MASGRVHDADAVGGPAYIGFRLEAKGITVELRDATCELDGTALLDHRDGAAAESRPRHAGTQAARLATGDIHDPKTREFLEQNKIPYIAKPFNIKEFRQLLTDNLNQTACQAK